MSKSMLRYTVNLPKWRQATDKLVLEIFVNLHQMVMGHTQISVQAFNT